LEQKCVSVPPTAARQGEPQRCPLREEGRAGLDRLSTWNLLEEKVQVSLRLEAARLGRFDKPEKCGVNMGSVGMTREELSCSANHAKIETLSTMDKLLSYIHRLLNRHILLSTSESFSLMTHHQDHVETQVSLFVLL
jgi:hypothetical protein